MRCFLNALFIALISFAFNACSGEKEIIKIGISPWPGYEPLVLGVEKGFYEDMDARIVRYATPSESFRALRDGIIDVAAYTADEVLHYAEVRDKPKMFLVLDISNGGDAIVARPEIKSISELKGKRVYVQSSALGDYLIKRATDFAHDVRIEEINVSTVELGKHLKDYKSKKVDALVTYEPFLTQLLNEGAHVIFDSTQIPQEIVDVMVTNNETIRTKQEALKKLVKGWYKSLEFINSNKKMAMRMMAHYENISSEEFAKSYSKLIIPSREETIEMLQTDKGSFKTMLQRLSELMFQKGSLNKKIDTSLLIESSLVEQKK